MKNISYHICLFIQLSFGQVAIQNNGNFQIHQAAEVGFHVDVINNGTLHQNLGTVLFYNETMPLYISGTQIPRFYDMEVEVPNNLYLDISTQVENSLSFIAGDIITPRDTPSVSIDFLSNAIFVLDDDFRHTNGYASYNSTADFTFPIGDGNTLRPLSVTHLSPMPNANVKAAYFNEDPNFPSTYSTAFNTSARDALVNAVSTVEFWDFDGPNNSLVTLTWNTESEISNLVNSLLNLRVVGWHTRDEEWKDLGNSNSTGTLENGSIRSIAFNPSDYSAVTFGTLISHDDLVIYNIISPNNDGKNDTFVIEGVEAFNNELLIINRWGNVVYKTVNYKNDWGGKANVSGVFRSNEMLPAGTYFYQLKNNDENRISTGWVYVTY